MTPLLVGLDVGSRHVKAGLVRADGRVLHVARRPTPNRTLADGGAVHPVDALLGTVEEVAREAIDAADAGEVAGIGIASMAEAGVLIGRELEPLHDVLAWHDPRSRDAADAIVAAVPVEELFRRTGLRAEAKHTLAKLARLATDEPAVARRARAWAGVADLVAASWTGRLVTAPSLACRTLAWNLARRDWDEDLLRLAGWAATRLPDVVELGGSDATLQADTASRLGLRSGIPVVVAGHDHVVGAFGAGVAAPGLVADSLGTAEAVLRVTDRPRLDDAVRHAGFSVGAHVVPGVSYVIGGLAASGALVEWFLDLVAAPRRPPERYAFLATLLEAGEPEPGAVIVRPTPRGRAAPDPDPAATASIEGLTLDVDRSALAWAVVDGLAFHARWVLDVLGEVTGSRIERSRVYGGGAANRALVRTKAAVRPIVDLAPEPEMVVLGAALAGGLAAGVFESVEAALLATPSPDPVETDAALSAAYDVAYRTRFLASPALAAVRVP